MNSGSLFLDDIVEILRKIKKVVTHIYGTLKKNLYFPCESGELASGVWIKQLRHVEYKEKQEMVCKILIR